MSLIKNFFHIFLYQPLFNALILIYQYLPGHDFGVAIIVLTILIRILIFPFVTKSIESQKVLSDLQVKVKEIQKKYKDDKERQAKETMDLYKREKINPFSAYIPLFVQLVVLIAFYRVVLRGLNPGSMSLLYGFVSNPGAINPVFLGIINLSMASPIMAILAGVAQFLQGKTMYPQMKKAQKDDKTAQFSNAMQKQMMYVMPLITVLFLLKLPSVIGIYWIVTSIFSVFQQQLILKRQNTQQKNA